MGKMMNKFLDFMHLNEYDDDDFDEYDDSDYEEEAPKAVLKKAPAKDTYLNDYEEDDEPEEKKVSRFKPVKSKVVPMRTGSKGMEVCVIKPSTVEDGREISDTLLSGRAVILNLEGLQVSIAQRIIDFASGACYSINGNLQKVSNYIFIITPESVDISGDFQDLLSGTGSFDVSAFRSGPEV
ncbi:MAG: cell division protein SepF [Lachnospiraceae bacterium]|nr:cell division protein SepF [Lachnospiraceae bacterium]